MGRLANVMTAREVVLDRLGAQPSPRDQWLLGVVANPAALTPGSEIARALLHERAFFPISAPLWRGSLHAAPPERFASVVLVRPQLRALLDRHRVALHAVPDVIVNAPEASGQGVVLPRGTAPVVLDVQAATTSPTGTPFHVPMQARSGDRQSLTVGTLTEPVAIHHGPVPHCSLTLTLPIGQFGDVAVGLVALAVEHLLTAALAQGNRAPWVVRIDYAGLGLSRPQVRRLEGYLNACLAAYGRQSGASGLVLGHVGYVQSYADARVQLDGGQACRLDLIAARQRSRPIAVMVTQEGAGLLAMTLRSPETGELTSDSAEPVPAALTGLSGRALAAICFDPLAPLASDRRTHTIGIASSTLEGSDGTWEITVENLSDQPVLLTFKVDEAMPMMGKVTSHPTLLTLSRSTAWDPEMSDFARPVFYDFMARMTGLMQLGDALPPHVLRCYGDLLAWPRVSVCFGADLRHMDLCTRARPAIQSPAEGGQSEVQVLERLLVPQIEDTVLGMCLDVVQTASVATLGAMVRDALRRHGRRGSVE